MERVRIYFGCEVGKRTCASCIRVMYMHATHVMASRHNFERRFFLSFLVTLPSFLPCHASFLHFTSLHLLHVTSLCWGTPQVIALCKRKTAFHRPRVKLHHPEE
jgi:hypothetical protein